MTEQFKDISRLLRIQGWERGANLTDIFEEELRTRDLIPATLTPDVKRIRRIIRRQETPFPDPAGLRQSALGIVNDYLGFEVTDEVLVGRSRVKEVARTRHLVVYLMRNIGDLSLISIARSLGRENHTTALNSIQQVEQWNMDPEVKTATDHLMSQLRNTIRKNGS